MKKLGYLFSVLWLSTSTLARAEQPNPMPQEQQLNLNNQQLRKALNTSIAPQQTHTTVISLTSEQLLQQLALLTQALDTASANADNATLHLLLPLYKKLPQTQQDPILLQFAQARLAQTEQNYSEAIEIFQTLLEKYPDITPIRVQLAESLIENHQYHSANKQITEIRQTPDIPKDILIQLNGLKTIEEREKDWSITGNLRFLKEKNVNNAPSQRKIQLENGELTLPEPKSATGIGFYAALSKDFLLADHWRWKNELSTEGKYYWDNHDYTDINTRFSAGIAWQNSQKELALLPFIERRWFATESYSKSKGIALLYRMIFSPQWQGFTNLQLTRKTYDDRTYLDGNQLSSSFILLYHPSTLQAWFTGIDLAREKTKDSSESYRYQAVRFGWEQIWHYGISSSITLGVALRNYDTANFFNIKRKDKEYRSRISLWKQNWHWYGFTPKLTWQWKKLTSNDPYYPYHKNEIFIEIQRNF
ncbi:TPR repeat-containing protein NMB0313 precursor [uncultured Avibacterium sp.]|uniref:TPR repeat-containing protein NMB0313 n=1 Tax=uncultured Avibacterium sp. TaxID=1936169 RepID=A0A486XB05_9PAST|nr:TPR repeat-containing protein NMB0313 precursor [uncultured Avibacterium sp.]